MRGISILATCLLPLASTVALPQTAPGSNGNPSGGPNKARADAVKEAFQFAWDGYWQYAFPHDELRPVTNGFSDSRNGWGATAVDALSTALIMRNKDVVDKILDFVPTINFSNNNTPYSVSLFETTIRYLGGLISGYDLLKGPLKDLVGDRASKVDALLKQSIALADRLSFAFNTPSGVPYNNLNYNTNSSTDWYNGIATIGTLVLEWTRLSDITGNQKYAQAVQKGESYLLNPQPAYGEPFPGLIGTWVNISNGNFLSNHVSWSGGDDSFYEYLIKMFVYDQTRFKTYRDRWIKAADSTIKYLASHPSSRPDLTFLAEANGQELNFDSQHLTCFDGGNFILGGLVLHRQDYITFGLDLVNGCRATYSSTATGIGPEIFSWNTKTLPENQTEFYNRTGFWIKDGGYVLRPEVIESFYYAYRATGDPLYQEWAWAAFRAINATTRARSGYSSITNVNVPGGGSLTDGQESFLFAEVLKYAYLIHAEDDEWQVEYGGLNGWVFNTEAHPFKVAGPLTGSKAT